MYSHAKIIYSHWGLIAISWNNLYDCPKKKSCWKNWFSYRKILNSKLCPYWLKVMQVKPCCYDEWCFFKIHSNHPAIRTMTHFPVKEAGIQRTSLKRHKFLNFSLQQVAYYFYITPRFFRWGTMEVRSDNLV